MLKAVPPSSSEHCGAAKSDLAQGKKQGSTGAITSNQGLYNRDPGVIVVSLSARTKKAQRYGKVTEWEKQNNFIPNHRMGSSCLLHSLNCFYTYVILCTKKEQGMWFLMNCDSLH